MSVVKAASVLLSVCVLTISRCEGQGIGSACGCNITNSHCDESGSCRCDPGWDGERCEHCVLMPGCVHGSCQQPWQCSCTPGWGGRFCDKDLSICSEQPCENGATCVMEDSGDFTCLCPESFHGNKCQLKTGPCLRRRSLCQNGGLCEDANGFAADLTCRCLAGFTGRRCENNVDDCLMKPCGNGATCLDGVNRFTCVCPTGFTGRFCTVNLDDCVSRPCLNAGLCLDGAAGFHCVCRPGFTGTICETPLKSHDILHPEWVKMGWEGSGGFNGYKINSSRHADRLFTVTVSERGASSLSEVQLIVLLVLAALTLSVVVLTISLVLHGHCRSRGYTPCSSLTVSLEQRSGQRAPLDEKDAHFSFLSVAEPEKKKLNTELV